MSEERYVPTATAEQRLAKLKAWLEDSGYCRFCRDGFCDNCDDLDDAWDTQRLGADEGHAQRAEPE